jgi:hypothetical protein
MTKTGNIVAIRTPLGRRRGHSSLIGYIMGNLRTGNKRHNRAIAALQTRKKLADAETVVVSKADAVAS